MTNELARALAHSGEIMFTVSCSDTWAYIVNRGSYSSIDEAIAGADRMLARCPKSTRNYRIHVNPRGYGYVNECDVVLSLLPLERVESELQIARGL